MRFSSRNFFSSCATSVHLTWTNTTANHMRHIVPPKRTCCSAIPQHLSTKQFDSSVPIKSLFPSMTVNFFVNLFTNILHKLNFYWIAYAERVCQANGTWGPLRQKPCYDKIFAYICKMRNEATFFNLTRDRHFKLECVHDAGLNQFMTTFYLIGCSVTIVSVSVAIFIFISFR